eukprot:Gregarina_sp_Poly_1__3490@NODE_2014_length_2858_cov_788_353278_g1301_i0_p3_GENE_NODE_2014_length_2858_cov_788_353278_g1301_i0NODE_2014_length_2858_cov_788_353278_g1301_i0_p3_ORF_typecomplete_len123_score6_02_NODE_2014_length_2858_cov_788_353278_g1301_i09191287
MCSISFEVRIRTKIGLERSVQSISRRVLRHYLDVGPVSVESSVSNTASTDKQQTGKADIRLIRDPKNFGIKPSIFPKGLLINNFANTALRMFGEERRLGRLGSTSRVNVCCLHSKICKVFAV